MQNKQTGLHQCPACGLYYKTEKRANECKVWCESHHSCNLDITKDAVEPKKQRPHLHI